LGFKKRAFPVEILNNLVLFDKVRTYRKIVFHKMRMISGKYKGEKGT